MWSLILSFVASWIPGIGKTLVDGYKAKLDASNTTEHIAADLAARELAVQQAEIVAQSQLKIAEIGHWYEPDHLFGYIMVFFMAKVVIWDTCLGLGSTPALRGDTATWAGMVMLFYVGKRGAENIARIIKR